MGRPPKYSTAEELQNAIDEYFKRLPSDEPITITGLCYHLGFESRQSFYRLEKNEDLSYTIKRARLRIERSYEIALRKQGRPADMFALKNHGWSDRQEIDHTSGGDKLGPLQVVVDSSETAQTLKKLRDGSEAD